jgi:hypothetical protein
MIEICKICETDPATERHHVRPKSKGGTRGEIVWCCSDCGGQIHMLFDNKTLANLSLEELIETNEMKTYVSWKKKHPGGTHRHQMSSTVKQWKKGHR